MTSIQKRPNGMWRARYRYTDAEGVTRERAAHFRFRDPDRKDPPTRGRKPGDSAQEWLDARTAELVTRTHLEPKLRKTTVAEWCDVWMQGYDQRPRTMLQARSHIAHIKAAFGPRLLSSIRASDVNAWTKRLRAEGFADSTVRVIYSRFTQVMSAAVADGLIPAVPVTRKNVPPAGDQRAYVATTEQIWALHDAMPEGLRPAILLGAFAGLRLREIVALRTIDVDFMRGVVTPVIQHPADPLKTAWSSVPIPIPAQLALELNRMPAKWGSSTIVVSPIGRPITPGRLDETFRAVRGTVEGLPEGFRLHDLRHYFASLLIASGLDVKVVQARLRHKSAKTTLDTYGHLWPDSDETSRAAVSAVFDARADTLRTGTA